MKYLKELTFKVGDLLVLDESYVEKTGIRNLAWLVLKTTPTGFYFLDIGGFREGIRESSATEWHPAWRVIQGELNE